MKYVINLWIYIEIFPLSTEDLPLSIYPSESHLVTKHPPKACTSSHCRHVFQLISFKLFSSVSVSPLTSQEPVRVDFCSKTLHIQYIKQKRENPVSFYVCSASGGPTCKSSFSLNSPILLHIFDEFSSKCLSPSPPPPLVMYHSFWMLVSHSCSLFTSVSDNPASERLRENVNKSFCFWISRGFLYRGWKERLEGKTIEDVLFWSARQ